VGIDRVLPKIFTVDSNGAIQPRPSNIRILYYGGLKSTNTGWDYISTSGTTYYIAPTTYPYCGHLDDPWSPTLDLNWAVPKEVFYTIDQFAYTDNNLFNGYWQKAIKEMTDPDSYIYQGWFKLNSVDIAQLDFRDAFYIEGQLFRLNKIYDYDPTRNELTKCEFVKLKDYPAYVAQTKTGYGGAGTGFTNGENMPTYRQMSVQSNNYSGSSARMGTNNFIAQTSVGCNISGSKYCSISEGCKNVNILGSSGVTVFSGIENVTVINSSGTTVSTSNQVIINGWTVPSTYNNTTYTYTPTLSGGSNLDSSTTYAAQYIRVGNVITVSGKVDLDPTLTATSTYIGISLPVASAFTLPQDCGGVAFCPTVAGMGGAIYANAAGGNARLQFVSSEVTNQSWYYTFTYQVK
jgi:hypothetical protein